MSENVTRPVLEPAAAAFAAATANPPYLFDLGPEEGRKAVDEVQSGEIAEPEIAEEWVTVQGGPTGEVQARIVRPAGAEGPLPVIVYLHGAGWVFGSAHTHDRLVRELAVGARAAVVFPEYDLSPEARYPVAIEQNYTVARWVVTDGAAKGLNADRIAVAGDSVGGNMTAALTLMAKERGDVGFVHQSLYYPVTDAGQNTDSYRELADGPWLTANAMAWFWDAYIGNAPKKRDEITASPLRASTEDLKGLPPAFVIVDQNDVLRDEGEAYAAKLTLAGVPTTSVRYNGIFHDFMMLNPTRATQAATGAIEQATHVLRKALGTS